jgi:hypothetical protein
MAQRASAIPDAGAWLALVHRSGAEGRRWAREYRRWQPVAAMNADCLALLHARRWEEGEALLRRFRAAVDGAEGAAGPATRALLERWYQAVFGYYLYCREEYDAAERAMVLASESIAAAVGHLPALLPLVPGCHEFRLHRARIARNRRRWAAMWDHVEAVRAMFEGRTPFCLLADGRPVGLAEVRAHYAALGPLDGPEARIAASFLDDRTRLGDLDRFVREMTRLPGFVIPYL